MRKSHGGGYPENWAEIAEQVKAAAGWCCVRCGHPNDRDSGHVLTVHHLDMNPSNSAWWNLLALCQKCHLHVQGKVILERPWLLDHSPWFRPYVAGYYASISGYSTDRSFVLNNIDYLIAIGQGRM